MADTWAVDGYPVATVPAPILRWPSGKPDAPAPSVFTPSIYGGGGGGGLSFDGAPVASGGIGSLSNVFGSYDASFPTSSYRAGSNWGSGSSWPSVGSYGLTGQPASPVWSGIVSDGGMTGSRSPAITGAGPFTGPQTYPVQEDGGAGIADWLQGLGDMVGSMTGTQDQTEIIPVGGAPASGGMNGTMLLALGGAAALAFLVLKKK